MRTSNLRIDNRAKELAIGELNRRLTEDRDRFLGAMQDMSYKLGAAETRLSQLEAPKADADIARQTAPERDIPTTEVMIAPSPERDESVAAEPMLQPAPEPRRSFLGRIFG